MRNKAFKTSRKERKAIGKNAKAINGYRLKNVYKSFSIINYLQLYECYLLSI